MSPVKKLRRRVSNLPMLRDVARSLFQPCQDKEPCEGEIRFPDEIWKEIKWKAEWIKKLDKKERVSKMMHKVLLRELELKLRDPDVEEVPPVHNVFGGYCCFGLVYLRMVGDDDSMYSAPTVIRVNYKYSGDESTGMSYL